MAREFWIQEHNVNEAFDVFTTEVAQTKPDFNQSIWSDFKDCLHVKEVTPGEKSFTRDEIKSIFNKYDPAGGALSHEIENELFGAGGDV